MGLFLIHRVILVVILFCDSITVRRSLKHRYPGFGWGIRQLYELRKLLMKIPTKREITLVQHWTYNIHTFPELQKKLKKSKVGTLSTIARVYKHETPRH